MFDLLDDSACLLVLGSSLTVMSSVRCVLGRAAVAFVVALAAACGYVPAARAFSTNTEIAFQANTGDLWTWAIDNPGGSTGMGMMAGSGPSVAPLPGFGSNHEIAFQANTGHLWTTGLFGGDSALAMMAGTSPSMNLNKTVAFQDSQGLVERNGLDGNADSQTGVMAGTSPSIADRDEWVMFQGSNGKLWDLDPNFDATDLKLGMMAGTSPSMNDKDDVAFQANTGDLYIIYNLGNGGGGDTGVKMMPGTSPSIDDQDDIAVQGSNGDLWIWIAPASGGHDLGLEMKAGTSPSISKDPGLVGGARPQASVFGGPGNDRLTGRSRNDLIYGARGNDLIRGARGNDQLYGGPGNDRIYGSRGNDLMYGSPGNDVLYGGPGNDRIYGEPGNDRIVDHRGATTVFPGSGANQVDVADRRGDDRVVCAPGSTNHIVADRGDRIARSCRSQRSTIRYMRSQQPPGTH